MTGSTQRPARFAAVRNFIALHGTYLLLQFVATPDIRDRAEAALKTGLREQGFVDLVGTPTRTDPLAGLGDVN